MLRRSPPLRKSPLRSKRPRERCQSRIRLALLPLRSPADVTTCKGPLKTLFRPFSRTPSSTMDSREDFENPPRLSIPDRLTCSSSTKESMSPRTSSCSNLSLPSPRSP